MMGALESSWNLESFVQLSRTQRVGWVKEGRCTPSVPIDRLRYAHRSSHRRLAALSLVLFGLQCRDQILECRLVAFVDGA
jgi:hypothetical protein